MIPGWVVRTAVVAACLFILMFDVGARMVIRIQLDDTATRAANEARRVLDRTESERSAKKAAQDIVDDDDAHLTTFVVGPDDRVRVTVSKHVKSYVLHRIGPLRDWYDIDVSATSAPSL